MELQVGMGLQGNTGGVGLPVHKALPSLLCFAHNHACGAAAWPPRPPLPFTARATRKGGTAGQPQSTQA